MKDFDSVILFVFGFVVIVALFLGMVTFVQKSFSTAPKVESPVSEDMRTQQKRQIQNLKDKERRLRDDQKQRMRDFQRMNRR